MKLTNYVKVVIIADDIGFADRTSGYVDLVCWERGDRLLSIKFSIKFKHQNNWLNSWLKKNRNIWVASNDIRLAETVMDDILWTAYTT